MPKEAPNTAQRETHLDTLKRFPEDISRLTSELDDGSLALTYRTEGWNIRQLVHHCADSLMNAFSRFNVEPLHLLIKA